MATPTINLEILQFFSPVLVFIMVFAIFYAIFQWTKLFGDNKIIHAIIAVVVAIFGSIISQSARVMIEYMIPWFTFLVIFGVILIVIFKMFGVSDSSITTAVKSSGPMWTIFIILIIIALGAISNAFGQKSLEYTSGEGTETTEGTSIETAGTGAETNVDPNSVGIMNPGNPGTTNTASGSFQQNLGATFYHPKILGMLFILLIASLAVRMLTSPPTS